MTSAPDRGGKGNPKSGGAGTEGGGEDFGGTPEPPASPCRAASFSVRALFAAQPRLEGGVIPDFTGQLMVALGEGVAGVGV